MKQIINGRRYDTAKAELLAEYHFGNYNNFRHFSEYLYVTSSGAYFLHGVGGGLSIYRVDLGDRSWSGGKRIIPTSREEAIAWLEKHRKTEVLEKHFPEHIADA